MNEQFDISYSLKDKTLIHMKSGGMCVIKNESGQCEVHYDSILNAVARIERFGPDKFNDEHDWADRFSYSPEGKGSIDFSDQEGNTCRVAYEAILDFGADRMREYFEYLIDKIPTPKDVFSLAREILGTLEAVVLEDEEILNQAGWIIMRTNPMEIYHPESDSKAIGDAAELVLTALRGERGGYN